MMPEEKLLNEFAKYLKKELAIFAAISQRWYEDTGEDYYGGEASGIRSAAGRIDIYLSQFKETLPKHKGVKK